MILCSDCCCQVYGERSPHPPLPGPALPGASIRTALGDLAGGEQWAPLARCGCGRWAPRGSKTGFWTLTRPLNCHMCPVSAYLCLTSARSWLLCLHCGHLGCSILSQASFT